MDKKRKRDPTSSSENTDRKRIHKCVPLVDTYCEIMHMWGPLETDLVRDSAVCTLCERVSDIKRLDSAASECMVHGPPCVSHETNNDFLCKIKRANKVHYVPLACECIETLDTKQVRELFTAYCLVSINLLLFADSVYRCRKRTKLYTAIVIYSHLLDLDVIRMSLVTKLSTLYKKAERFRLQRIIQLIDTIQGDSTIKPAKRD